MFFILPLFQIYKQFCNKYNKYKTFFMRIPIVEYYNSLVCQEKKTFRVEVCKRCSIEAYQFYRRMREDKWSHLEEKEIRNIIDERSYTLI